MRTYLVFFIILGFACTEPEPTCFDTNCADYISQVAAQSDFEANPDCRSDLDRDNDHMACEDYFNGHTGGSGAGGCPTTANCGCSNKRKADCASACCQWIVGEGCKCK